VDDGEHRDDRDTTGRLLALLSLLQGRPRWSGPELADRLGVTVRTVRRDIDRLRRLGYPVHTEVGVTGGYALGSGGRAMPPLMLDRGEAIAVAVCLRSVATDSLAGGGEAAIRALGKLEQLLPPTLRRHVGALGSMTSRLGGGDSPVEPELLVTLSRACRDSERLRARYRDGRGRHSERTIDPHRLVQTPHRWYLVAHDRDRNAWRTFRVDRLLDVVATGHLVRLEHPPDPVPFVQQAITTAPYRHQARVELAAPIDDVRPLVPATAGALTPIDAERTMLTTGADDLRVIVFHVLGLGVDFTVHDPPSLRDELAALGARLTAAAARSQA
jgi:predicted DNA-binding transcriptional regulator YafY